MFLLENPPLPVGSFHFCFQPASIALQSAGFLSHHFPGKVTVKGPGVAKITVKAAATTDYKATSKTVTVTVAPKKQGISLVNKIKKQLTIKWKKNTKASGYQVVYSTNKKFTGKKTVRKAKTTTSYKIKGLKKGKKYYVKVRSYKTVNGKRIYGAYSTAKKATIKQR